MSRQDSYIRSFVAETRSIVEAQTKHFDFGTWRLDIALSGQHDFKENKPVRVRHCEMVIEIEFELNKRYREPRCSHQMHIRFEPRVQDVNLSNLQTTYKQFPTDEILVVTIKTSRASCRISDSVRLALKYDYNQHRDRPRLITGTCVVYDIAGVPKQSTHENLADNQQGTPEYVLKHDKSLRIAKFYNLDTSTEWKDTTRWVRVQGIGRRKEESAMCESFPNSSDKAHTIWRTAAVGYRYMEDKNP